MESAKLKILLLGDYSNMHSQLGQTLSRAGHDVTVISAGSGFQDTKRNIDISRRPNKLSGALLAARVMWPLHRYLRGYDIVALQNPHFLQLKPSRIQYFFRRLRRENGAVFLTAAGTDELYVREALDPSSPLRYNEYRVGTEPAPYALTHPQPLQRWQDADMVALANEIYDGIDGIVTALYEYHVAVTRQYGDASKVAYGGIPVDTAALPVYDLEPNPQCVRLFLGRHRGRYSEKGTAILEEAARIVADRHPGRVALNIVENVPYAQYVDTMQGSHVVLDQIYSYSPATNALIAMSHGLNVVTGGEDDYYRFIGETKNRPIINASTNTEQLVNTLEQVVTHPELLRQRGLDGRRFVEKHNDATIVAKRFLDFWTSKL